MKIVKILQNGKQFLLARVVEQGDNVLAMGFEVGDTYELVVCSNYDRNEPENQQWDYGHYYKPNQLQVAVDHLFERVVGHNRLSELATKFKDGLMEDDVESAMEYFEDECEMTEQEMEWFGIITDDETIDFVNGIHGGDVNE